MTTATTAQTTTAAMSSDSLALRFLSDGETSPTLVRPHPSLDTISAPFLAEEAYPRILSALLDTHLGDDDSEHRICLSEDNIAAIASAASGALFGVGDDVFARFLVVPRVESAISVLLWRVRINSTCAPGQSGIQLPSVPVRVLASSLAGLLDNTKLYASSKQGAFPAPHTPLQKPSPSRVPLDHHHLAPPTPLTATASTCSDPCLSLAARRPPPPRLSFSRPMTPPDSAVVETTPISASTSTPTNNSFLTPTTPTSKRANLPRVKFRPPPIITRTTPSRPIPGRAQSASAVTLTFAAAGLSGCEIEPLPYVPPKTKPTSGGDNDKEDVKDEPEQDRPCTPPPAPEPALSKKTPARAPSPNPPRAPSPTKRVLRKAPPTPKSRPRSLVRPPSPTKQQSMWTPSPAEAHYRSPSPVKLTPPVRPKSMLGADSRTGSMENSPAPSKLTDLPSSLTSSPALLPKSKLRAPSPVPRTPSPIPPSPRTETVPEVDVVRSPSPSQSMPGSSLRSPSSNLLRSPGSSMFNGSSVGFGSPAESVKDLKDRGLAAGASGDKTPVTPTPRRTVSVSGVKFEVIESSLPGRHASLSAPNRDVRSSTPTRNSRSSSPDQNLHPSTPSRRASPNQDAVSPSPNALRTRANLGASPGATSLSTIPSLSPFPESDSEFEFGGKGKDKDEEDVTLTARARNGLGLTRVETPSRASTSTPTRKSPPPINTSPSRNSSVTKRSYTLGVPMTQLTSAGASLRAGGATSESEAESLPFPGSQSTLSLPGDISLPELVSPFTVPLELPSSSTGESSGGDGSPAGAPWGRRQLPVPPQRPGLATNPKPVQAAGPSLGQSVHSRSGSGPITHSRSGSSGPAAHSRSGSTGMPTHSRSGSEQIRLGGRESEMDLLVPFAVTEALSRADVIRLMNKSGSVAENSGSDSPVHTSVVRGAPVPVFMTPGSAPPGTAGGKVTRPTSMALVRSPPSSSSESSSPSPLLSNQAPATAASSHSRIASETSVDEDEDEEDELMARTTEVGVGAGRARVKSGVGIGGGRVRGGKPGKRERVESAAKAKVDSGLARSESAMTARPRVDSTRARTESLARQRVDTITRPRVDSTTRPRVDSNVRARVDSGLRRKSGANDSPVSPADATSPPRSPSTTSGRIVGKSSREALSRRTPIGRKVSATSMRKSSTSSLRSTTTTTTRTLPTTVSTKKTSVSSISGTSTPRSGTSTPRSRSMSMGRENGSGPGTGSATPKQGTPRPSLSTPRTSTSSGRNITSPRPSVTIPRTSTTSPRASPRTPVAAPNKVTGAKVPPARPLRSSLRPGPRSTTVSTSAPAVAIQAAATLPSTSTEHAPLTAPAVSAVTFTSTTTSPPRTRATSLDTNPTNASLTAEGSRPRRTTSVSTKPPPLSRSSVSTAALAPPPMLPAIRARVSYRTSSSVGHEDGAVPFPIPESASESEGGLKVPDNRGPKRSLSVSSAARRLISRTRGASPVPSMPTDSVSIVTAASSVDKEKAPKSGRSLSRLAFAALLPKRNANNGAAEAKAALAQAKAREVAEAKARAKAAAEEAKVRAKAEAEAKAAEKAAKEPRRIVRRIGSMSKKSSVVS
ncbi:hypothetical protein FRC10_007857 [Ceratobasidium sp. 414]|nr:hypothetical protein FRC10_007857 [Ceratobasidium sp. 414]